MLAKQLITLYFIIFSSANHALCRDEYLDGVFYRTESGLTAVPDDIPADAAHVHLSNNQISIIPGNVFSHLSHCLEIKLNENSIRVIQDGAFNGLSSLLHLNLSSNQIGILQENLFASLSYCEQIMLEGNSIRLIHNGAFNGLASLKQLTLHWNSINAIRPNMFSSLVACKFLWLAGNQIPVLEKGVFNGLEQLQDLGLNSNDLTKIEAGIFVGIDKLIGLHLQSNNIVTIEANALVKLNLLENLYLMANELTELRSDMFNGLNSLTLLWIGVNKLTSIDSSVLADLPRPLNLRMQHDSTGTKEPHLLCDQRLCWLKKEEEAGTITWIAHGDRPQEPLCANNIMWANWTCTQNDSDTNDSDVEEIQENENTDTWVLIVAAVGGTVGGIFIFVVIGVACLKIRNAIKKTTADGGYVNPVPAATPSAPSSVVYDLPDPEDGNYEELRDSPCCNNNPTFQ